MDYANSDLAGKAARRPLLRTARDGLKIVIVGGFGVGKTTLVGSVSEIPPLITEESLTLAGGGQGEASSPWHKVATTVSFDFGRITLNDQRVLYLFGAPGQDRFASLWPQLFTGSLGAVVLVDTRRIEDSWCVIDRLETDRTPFIIAVNRFDSPGPCLAEVRDSLTLRDDVPLVECDARRRDSCKAVLLTLVNYLTGQVGLPPVSEPYQYR